MAAKEEFVELVINGNAVSSKSRGITIEGVVLSIGVSFGICLICLLVFCFLRKRLRSVYEPRAFIPARGIWSPKTSTGFLSWVPPVFTISNKDVLNEVGLDAYFYLRYNRLVMILCACLAVPLMCVLLPLHISGTREEVYGLDKLSIIHLDDHQLIGHVAHLVLCFFCTAFCMFVFHIELKKYFRLKADYILRRSDACDTSSTILIKGLNPDASNEATVRRFFEQIPIAELEKTNVQKVWFNRSYPELHKAIKRRKVVLRQLEKFELWLVESSLGLNGGDPNRANNNKDSAIMGNLWREYLSPEQLKDMYEKKGERLAKLKGELCRLNADIHIMQSQDISDFPANSCFVQFRNSLTAFVAARSLDPTETLGKHLQVFDKVYPADIIWSNLNITSWKRGLCSVFFSLINYVFIFGWAIPVALLTIATQVDTMEKLMPRVHWVANSPRLAKLMSSVLCPIMVSSLTSMIPYCFRVLAKRKGFPTNTMIEMDVQKYLFLFMFFQLFLIVTVSTGLPALFLTTLVNASAGAMTLANSLPKATNFFISYLIANSLTTAGNALMQSMHLFLTLWHDMFARTPREKFRNKYRSSTVYWGSVFPLVTNVTSIALAYALISPVILLSAILGLGALYISFKYRIVYCYAPRCVSEGDYYPKAIFQLFAGFYCQQISLLGSFLVAGQIHLAVAAGLVIIATMMSHRYLYNEFIDMTTRIPMRRNVMLSLEEGLNETPSPDASSPGSVLSQTPWVRSMPTNASRLFHAPASVFNASTSPLSRLPPKLPLTPGSPGSPRSPDSQFSMVTLADNEPGNEASPAPRDIGSNRAGLGSVSPSVPMAHDSWDGLFDAMALDFNSLTIGQQEHIASFLFEHPDRWVPRPCVWLPTDWKGVAQDQIHEMQHLFTDLRSSCNGAEIDANGIVKIHHAPPDFDPREIMNM